MSTTTDPYQPVEQRYEIVRRILDVMAAYPPRLVIQTRAPLVVRDTDRLQAIVEAGGRVQVNMTVTTDNDDIRRAMEPQCPRNEARLKAVARLNESGIQTCITMTRLLPVKDTDAFARRMLETGCQRFIIQPFHVGRGQQQFQRGTRDLAAG